MMITFLVDRKNPFLEDFLRHVGEYIQYEIRFYDEIKEDELADKKKLIYATPASSINEKISNFLLHSRLVNPFSLQEVLINKIRTDTLLRFHNLRAPRSELIITMRDYRRFIKENGAIIIKSPDQCGGAGHFIVSFDEEEDKEIAYAGNSKYVFKLTEERRAPEIAIESNHLMANLPLYVQRFLKPDDDAVWRAYVVGGEVKFLSVRKRKEIKHLGEYIINVCRGAEYIILDNSANKDVVQLSGKILRSFKIDIGAIDFLMHGGKPYILEMDCDGAYNMICREFYNAPSYNEKFNFDFFIAEWLKKKLKS